MANYVLVRLLCGIWFALDALHFFVHPQLWLGRGLDEKRFSTHPIAVVVILATWLLASVGLAVGWHPWVAATLLLVFSRHYYIGLRWRSLLRGAGAVGFMPYWTALYIFLLESVAMFYQHAALELALFRVLRIDFAVIFLCAGTYKALTGYLKGEGVEYALANPMWTYGFRFFAKTNPSSSIYRLTNIAVCSGQIVMGILLLLPFSILRELAALGMMATFLVLAVAFRIGRLGLLMATIPLLFMPELGWAAPLPAHEPIWNLPAAAVVAFQWVTYIFISLLPFVKIVQYTNLFGDRSLPKALQALVNRYAGLIPIIIWRVFSVDITNFFIRISLLTRNGEVEYVGERSAYSPWSWRNLWLKLRYLHVGESVAIAAMFNTQKHFTSQPDLFNKRLVRYARTLSALPEGELKFQYVLIRKTAGRMEYVPLVDYFVDRSTESVREERLVLDQGPASKARFSPIRESAGYGTYVRKGN
jgi:hypothetical protein